MSLATLLLAAAALFGPPYISIELPPNPYDRTTAGAFLLVHTFHHDNETGLTVSGRAEGIVGGKRVSQPLALEKTSRPGVYALRKSWSDDGVWTLVLTVDQGGPREWAVAEAMVEVARGGKVVGVSVPREPKGDQRFADGRFPRAVSAREVDLALSALAR
ncbi:MAG: hypothetical protein NW201_11620 [Gemmatimonadales bacterium]|nr:hypothetical protein [Gemmatimonadales bacterium]